MPSNGTFWPALIIPLLAIIFAWVFFRAESWSDALSVIQGMIGLNGILLPSSWTPLNNEELRLFSKYSIYFVEKLPYQFDTLINLVILGFIVLAFPNTRKLITIFILPPSKTELFNRLKSRDMKDKNIVEKRMKQFDEDINHWENYDFVVINDNLDACYREIIQFINKRVEKLDYSYDKKNIQNHILKLRR